MVVLPGLAVIHNHIALNTKHGALCISRRQKCIMICNESFYNHGKFELVFTFWKFKIQSY